MTIREARIGQAQQLSKARAVEPDTQQVEEGEASGLAALHNPGYRLFFGGSMISNIGMWMQQVAQGWLVVTLTSSEFLVGLVAFCAMAPSLFLALFGGVLADRFDKRRLLIAAQVVPTVLVTMLATLVYTEKVQLWHVMVISAGLGTTMALSAPSWQAIIPEIVGKKNLMNAIALNSAQFNLTRIIGPSLGGILIRYIGIAGCYYLNALSYVFFLVAMIFIRPKHAARLRQAPEVGVFSSMGAALRYAWGHPVIRIMLILAAVQTIFLFPYTTLLPVFAKDILKLGATGYSVLLTAAGAGAFVGALMLTFRSQVESKGRLMLFCQVVFAIGVIVFAISPRIEISIAALFFVGWALVTFLATGNTLVQTIVPDELRGRVMSIWMLAGFGLMPIGSLQAGAVAALVSPSFALIAGAAITLIVTATVAVLRWNMFRPGVGLQAKPHVA